MEMILEGVCAIAKGENPTIVREIMQVFVSVNRRGEAKAKVSA
jgi:flagellar motor component MotA